jgi:hypothetical protein
MNDQQQNILFEVIDWEKILKEEHPGENGSSNWRVKEFAGLRIRIVEYEPGYLADHWCKKGHIVHCLEGSFSSEMETGETYFLSKGMSYVVSDEMSSHRSSSKDGVKLLIIDGEFLQYRM